MYLELSSGNIPVQSLTVKQCFIFQLCFDVKAWRLIPELFLCSALHCWHKMKFYVNDPNISGDFGKQLPVYSILQSTSCPSVWSLSLMPKKKKKKFLLFPSVLFGLMETTRIFLIHCTLSLLMEEFFFFVLKLIMLDPGDRNLNPSLLSSSDAPKCLIVMVPVQVSGTSVKCLPAWKYVFGFDFVGQGVESEILPRKARQPKRVGSGVSYIWSGWLIPGWHLKSPSLCSEMCFVKWALWTALCLKTWWFSNEIQFQILHSFWPNQTSVLVMLLCPVQSVMRWELGLHSAWILFQFQSLKLVWT